MKNAVLIFLVVAGTAFNSFAATSPVNEKVLKTFNDVFKQAVNVRWNEKDKVSQADFDLNTIKTRALFDSNGNLIQTVRYYGEQNLPSHILAALKKKYTDKEIWGVTEVSNENGLQYEIAIRDAKHWFTLSSDANGNIQLVKKFNRGDL